MRGCGWVACFIINANIKRRLSLFPLILTTKNKKLTSICWFCSFNKVILLLMPWFHDRKKTRRKISIKKKSLYYHTTYFYLMTIFTWTPNNLKLNFLSFIVGESGAFLDRGIFGQSTFRPFNVLLEQLYFNLI